MRYWLPRIAIVLGAFGLLLGAVLLWREWSKRFPNLPPGRYVGTLTGMPEQQRRPVQWYLEREQGQSEVLSVVLHENWQPQRIMLVPSSTASASQALPLLIQGPKQKYLATGAQIGEGTFSGTLEPMGAGPSIVWTLRPISQGLDSSARESERNLTLWLSLRRELSQVNQLIVRAEALVPEQRAEVERISESIQDVPKFKARADEKYRELVRMLDEQRQILDQRQREVQDLAQRFEIAQRVTGMGKLVSLARESFERENRWFDSMLRAAPAGLSGSVQEAIQRGEKIIELKREIRKERAKLGLEARAGNAQVQGAP